MPALPYETDREELAPIELGQLPIDAIANAQGLELEAGEVVLTVNAQIHASRRHPEDYVRCIPHLADVIASPDFIGDDLRNREKIEIVGRVPALGSGLLIAVNLERDSDGRYLVSSFYPVGYPKITNRRAKGFLSDV